MNPDIAKVANTHPIDGNANPLVVFTPDADKKFVVTKWYLIPDAGGTVKFQSKPSGAAVDLSGLMTLAAATVYQDGSGEELVFKGRANGDAFQIANAGTINLRGYAVILEARE